MCGCSCVGDGVHVDADVVAYDGNDTGVGTDVDDGVNADVDADGDVHVTVEVGDEDGDDVGAGNGDGDGYAASECYGVIVYVCVYAYDNVVADAATCDDVGVYNVGVADTYVGIDVNAYGDVDVPVDTG